MALAVDEEGIGGEPVVVSIWLLADAVPAMSLVPMSSKRLRMFLSPCGFTLRAVSGAKSAIGPTMGFSCKYEILLETVTSIEIDGRAQAMFVKFN